MGGSTQAKRGEARGASRPATHRKHEVIGVLLITLSLLVLLSLISFTPTDVPLFGTPPADATGPVRTQNMIGLVGATLSASLFWFAGAGAYLLPFLLVSLGTRCFFEGELRLTPRSVAGAVVALLFLSGLLHLEVTAVPTLFSGLVYRGRAGGVSGAFLADLLRGYFASTGAHIILLAGLVVSLLVTTPVSLVDLMGRLGEGWDALREGVAALLPERDEREKKAETKRKRREKAPVITREADEASAAVVPPVEEPAPAPAVIAASAVRPEPVEAEEEPEPAAVMSLAVTTGYLLPDPRELLEDPVQPSQRLTDEQLKAQSEVLTRALQNFGIEGKVTEVRPGPVVTMFEFEPAPGVKVARIVNLADDLALAMKATSLRIVAPLPGKSVVGIEVPNPYREIVAFKEVITSEAFGRARSKLTLALGKDIFGAPVCADLKTMPHLLVAGATGTGKSVCLNSMLLSLLFNARPDEVKLLLVDPKMLELQTYEGIPHLLRPVITDPKSAARGLTWVVQEMERRYKLLAEAGVRNIDAYNRRVMEEQGLAEPQPAGGAAKQEDLPMEFLSEEERLSAGESTAPEPAGPAGQPETPPAPLPYIVVMIDELADLMMVAPKEVEEKIARLAQMARASGIHLVLATQRPSVDVLTGLIKANFPARIAFQVSSKTDSRTILDSNGAEALLGKGDMLYLASGTGRLTRVHGSFVADDDVHRVVEFVKRQATPSYSEELQASIKQEEAAAEQEKDEVYEQAKDLVISSGQASASLIQRRLRVGYPRAARMVERMQEEGIVGAAGRDGRREVLVRRGPVGGEPV